MSRMRNWGISGNVNRVRYEKLIITCWRQMLRNFLPKIDMFIVILVGLIAIF